MKKNGFTLIELLAVIVILAIIALIATPIILNIINDARESANERSKELYATAVKTAIMKKKIEDPQVEIKGSYTQTNAGRTLTSASGNVVLNVTYDGDVQCEVIEVLDNYELKLDGCKVEGVYSNGTVTSPSGPGGSNNPTGGQEPEDNWDGDKTTQFYKDSWATIVSNVQNGNTSRYNVGDEKPITLSSNDSEIAGTYTVRIANKTNTGEVCTQEKNSNGETYSKTACGFVIEFADIITIQPMNSNGTSVGGWPASELYDYVNNDIYNSLPVELKNAIIYTTVVSGYGKNDAPNKVSSDRMYLSSVSEIYEDGYDTARYLTRQLDYYEGKTKDDYWYTIKQYNGNNSCWWLRSVIKNFDGVYDSVRRDYFNCVGEAYCTNGVAPAFRIG